MSATAIIIILLAVGTVFSGILLLKQSAKKFDLTEEQLKKIKERNEKQNEEEQEE